MAARRLLIVMLILLGLSTLAAALVPQRTLRNGTATTPTATQPAPTTSTTATAAPIASLVKITADKAQPTTVVSYVGYRFTLLVKSKVPTQLSIPEYGLVGFSAPAAPARFELLTETPGRFGILFEPSGNVAARLEILPASARAKQKKRKKESARSRAREGSGRP